MDWLDRLVQAVSARLCQRYKKRLEDGTLKPKLESIERDLIEQAARLDWLEGRGAIYQGGRRRSPAERRA